METTPLRPPAGTYLNPKPGQGPGAGRAQNKAKFMSPLTRGASTGLPSSSRLTAPGAEPLYPSCVPHLAGGAGGTPRVEERGAASMQQPCRAHEIGPGLRQEWGPLYVHPCPGATAADTQEPPSLSPYPVCPSTAPLNALNQATGWGWGNRTQVVEGASSRRASWPLASSWDTPRLWCRDGSRREGVETRVGRF